MLAKYFDIEDVGHMVIEVRKGLVEIQMITTNEFSRLFRNELLLPDLDSEFSLLIHKLFSFFASDNFCNFEVSKNFDFLDDEL